jgi:hypothetical protein
MSLPSHGSLEQGVSCSLCDDIAVVKVALSHGCIARPDDREQYLCWHHWHKAYPLGPMEIMEKLDGPETN